MDVKDDAGETAEGLSATSSASSRRPIIFGEVLFDQFPNGKQVLGGAPFNVAWNLTGMGLKPHFVSAVGDDDLGRRVQSMMVDWGMDTSGLQQLSQWPTGTVEVHFDQSGEPSYTIVEDQAYDHLTTPSLDELRQFGSLLYHGSLICRSEEASRVLEGLKETNLPRFVDINVREPHFDLSWTEKLLTGARWIKLNADELRMLSQQDEIESEDQLVDAVQRLTDQFGAATYFVTLGSDGACAVDAGEVSKVDAPTPKQIKDPVGAGDAFASAIIAGIHGQRTLTEMLCDATEFAARICGIEGATTVDRSIYKETIDDC